MALQYVKITDQSIPTFSFVKALYEAAFPIVERRDWKTLLSFLNHPDMQLDLIEEEKKPVGLIIWWEIGEWLFIEHFAIAANTRGGGYGSEVMRHYLEKAKGKMLLEVEPPLTADAQRRISFYERLGLTVIDTAYRQPSYIESGVDYPMFLMATVSEITVKEKAALFTLLKLKVYQV